MRKIAAFMVILVLSAGISLADVSTSYPAALYTGEAVVQTQQASERRKAMRKALEQVLHKLSGLRYFDDYPLLEPALSSAADMVVSFHYRKVTRMLADGDAGEQQRLVVMFSALEVDELLKQIQLPLWQPERKPAEIWVVVDQGLDRRVMPLELAYVQDAMNDVADQRGLPVIWPKSDENGDYEVDVQLLWGGYTEDLSAHGNTEILVAAARREGPEWNVRWNLAYGEQSWTWRSRGIDLQSTLVEGLQQAVDEIARLNTIVAADQGVWVHEITVTGLNSQAAYERCLAYLQNLSLVDRVSVNAATPGLVIFRLELNALPDYLEQTLQPDGVLEFSAMDERYILLP